MNAIQPTTTSSPLSPQHCDKLASGNPGDESLRSRQCKAQPCRSRATENAPSHTLSSFRTQHPNCLANISYVWQPHQSHRCPPHAPIFTAHATASTAARHDARLALHRFSLPSARPKSAVAYHLATVVSELWCSSWPRSRPRQSKTSVPLLDPREMRPALRIPNM